MWWQRSSVTSRLDAVDNVQPLQPLALKRNSDYIPQRVVINMKQRWRTKHLKNTKHMSIGFDGWFFLYFSEIFNIFHWPLTSTIDIHWPPFRPAGRLPLSPKMVRGFSSDYFGLYHDVVYSSKNRKRIFNIYESHLNHLEYQVCFF